MKEQFELMLPKGGIKIEETEVAEEEVISASSQLSCIVNRSRLGIFNEISPQKNLTIFSRVAQYFVSFQDSEEVVVEIVVEIEEGHRVTEGQTTTGMVDVTKVHSTTIPSMFPTNQRLILVHFYRSWGIP